jgi:hypothetical protein
LPYNQTKELWVKDINYEAKSIFENLQSFSKMMDSIHNRKIANFIWHNNKDQDKGYIELDNGCIISDRYMAPSGTGLAGLRFWESYENLLQIKEYDFIRVF